MPDDDNNQDQDGENRPNDMKPPPQFPTMLIWIIILFVLPLGLIYMMGSKENEEMSTSGFLSLLANNQIKELVIEKNPSTDRSVAVGKYKDDQGNERAYEAEVFLSDDFLEMVEQSGVVDWKIETKDPIGRTLLLFIVPLLIVLLILYFLFARQLRNAGKGAMQFGKSRARLSQNRQKITFSDVAGIEEAKEEVEEVIDYLKDPDKFKRLGGQIPKGVIMVGPPGTGKTLLARAIAGEADVPFFNISGSDFVEMFVGVGASRVRDMFEQGKRSAPCIIFIDEIDAVGRSRFSGYGGGHEEREQTLNALLVEMDGFEGKSGVIVMAATNRPDVLDPALLRPGRFDRQISIDLPDFRGRHAILNVHAKKVKLADNVDLEIVARGTPGFSGADLANLVNESALLAAREDKMAIYMDDLEEARDKVCWGKERRSRVIDDHEKKVTAYHEAGHALIGLHCDNTTPLHKVTIIPRGNALGATMHLPEYDKYTHTKTELLDELTVLMGGRCAEKIIFNEITSGAYVDIKQASAISRKMVCEWGMSESVGLLNYGDIDGYGQEPYHGGYSPETAREIDLEVRQIITGVSQRAMDILMTHRDQLEKLGEQLLVEETMDVFAIKDLLDMPIGETEKSRRFKGNGSLSSDEDTPDSGDDDDDGTEGVPLLVEAPADDDGETPAPVIPDALAEDDAEVDNVEVDDKDKGKVVDGPLPETAESRAPDRYDDGTDAVTG